MAEQSNTQQEQINLEKLDVFNQGLSIEHDPNYDFGHPHWILQLLSICQTEMLSKYGSEPRFNFFPVYPMGLYL
jgi:hypothetical protein